LNEFSIRGGKDIYWELPGGHFTPNGNRIVGHGVAQWIAPLCRGAAAAEGPH